MKRKLRNYIILILPFVNISISFRSPVVLGKFFISYLKNRVYLKVIKLVPGFAGSQLQAKLNKSSRLHYVCNRNSNYFNIWFSYEIVMPMVAECWV